MRTDALPMSDLVAACEGTVAHWSVSVGDDVVAGATVGYVELMKMEHAILAPCDGVVEALAQIGTVVVAGASVGALSPAAPEATTEATTEAERQAPRQHVAESTDSARADVAEVVRRHLLLTDEARPAAVEKRRARGFRTARENLADLVDPGTFVELGGLAIAAQRGRKGVDTLITDTPADGLITGVGEIDGRPCAIAIYDATVLAGTQGFVNHRKKDRLFALAKEQGLPLVLLAEGGGGRPGDTDVVGGAWLDAASFRLMAALPQTVPTVAVVNGYCFAGNAALAGVADIIIATEASWIGMAGPAMIAGGGLGKVAATDIGPIDVQRANGVVDVVVDDEREGAELARQLVGMLAPADRRAASGTGPAPHDTRPHGQRALRTLVPTNRRRTYEMRTAIRTIVDATSLVELRRDAAPGMITALAAIGGRTIGILANDPSHLGGAIDADAADSAVQHLELCNRRGLPIVVLCDTPGFMVGPEAERAGGVRRFGKMFTAAAALEVPIVAVVTRKAYGLGAMAMFGGHTNVPVLTVGWPTSELGPMGLEGAVQLGFARELAAIADADERAEREAEMIALAYEHARGLNIATFGELDDVIDPAGTRATIISALGWSRPR